MAEILLNGRFIRSEDGVWYNLDHVTVMKVGRNKTSRYIAIHIANFTYNLCADICSDEEMQEKLDSIVKLIEYEAVGD